MVDGSWEETAMSKASVMACAAALLFSPLSGCTLDTTSLNVFAACSDRYQVIEGSLESVSSSAESTLSEMGVAVSRTREGDAIVLTSNTKEGNRFTLVFTSVKTSRGDQTRVRIDWKDQADTSFWLQLVEVIATAQLEQSSQPPK
jgi:hypothetical protein